jgi:AraC-like DNA-binding protein
MRNRAFDFTLTLLDKGMKPVDSLYNEIIKMDPDQDRFLTDEFLIISNPATSKRQLNHLPKGQENYCISLLYHGTIATSAKGGKAPKNGPAILLLKNATFPVFTLESDCQMVTLCFSQKFLENENMPWHSYLDHVFFHKILPLEVSELYDFHKYLSLIVYEYQRSNGIGPAVIANLLMIILKMIANRTVETAQAENSSAIYFQFKVLIEQQFKKQHHVQAYADQLFITAEMLGKIVKETVNKTPKQLIDDRLIIEAKRMLIWSNTSNKEIAFDLGFESDSYFNRYFKKHCHQTPLSFRQQLRK